MFKIGRGEGGASYGSWLDPCHGNQYVYRLSELSLVLSIKGHKGWLILPQYTQAVVCTWGRKTQRETPCLGCPSCRNFPILLFSFFMARSNWLLHCSGLFKETMCFSSLGLERLQSWWAEWASLYVYTPKTHRALEQEERNSSRLLRQHVQPASHQSSFRRYLPEDRQDRCNCSGSFRLGVVYKVGFLSFPVKHHRSIAQISKVCYLSNGESTLYLGVQTGFLTPRLLKDLQSHRYDVWL